LAGPSRQLPYSLCSVAREVEPNAAWRRPGMVGAWPEDELRALPLEAFDERYRRYRLSVPEAERAMAGSLRRYGQMSPVVVCLREERAVLVDGFKRLAAARSLRGLGTLLARRAELDERSARASTNPGGGSAFVSGLIGKSSWMRSCWTSALRIPLRVEKRISGRSACKLRCETTRAEAKVA